MRRKPGLFTPHYQTANSKGCGHSEQSREPWGQAQNVCAARNRETVSIYKHIYIYTLCVCVGIYMHSFAFHKHLCVLSGIILQQTLSKFPSFTQWRVLETFLHQYIQIYFNLFNSYIVFRHTDTLSFKHPPIYEHSSHYQCFPINAARTMVPRLCWVL